MDTPLCVDASVVVRLLVDTAESDRVQQLWEKWEVEGRALVAPSMLYYEVTNALYRYERGGFLTADEVQQGLVLASGLQIHLLSDPALHLEAAVLARSLSLSAAYDSHYLALAQRLGAEFWTADRRLTRQVGPALPFVRCVIEGPGTSSGT